MTDPRSLIPSVDSLVGSQAFAPLLHRYTRERVVGATRVVVDDVRARISAGEERADVSEPTAYARHVEARLMALDVPSLRRVINATGVVLHTNLGRAPLAAVAIDAMKAAAEYANLEYDLGSGVRGSRYVHCVSLLREITGAEDALVVNNAAAGLTLALNTLARDRGVAVSRGELVEIGGGFRIPEVLERAGAVLVEVGSTNRTRLEDYRAVLPDHDVAALLKVHRSNFRISGFTEEATVAQLVELGSEHGLPLVHDLGSGLMVDPAALSLPDEPRAVESVAAGTDVVVFSGDKLLGGPQAGILAGRAEPLARMRDNPLCRALRVDKVTLAGLEATLRLYREPERALSEIPALRMLATSAEELKHRADGLAARLKPLGVQCSVRETCGAVGGGTYPEVEQPSWAVALETGQSPHRLAMALREGDPPVIGRIVDDVLRLDVRTVLPGQEEALLRRVEEAALVLSPQE
jgi:L-seryl-tRNA(Ser) seleniumtransferase